MTRRDVWALGMVMAAVACSPDDGDDAGGSGGWTEGVGGSVTGGTTLGGAGTGGALGGSGGIPNGGSESGGSTMGGAATGGGMTGGAGSGGTASGGSPGGGSDSGGASSGGAATGGTESGGASSGGAATGGTESGGASSGGAASGGTGGGSSSGCGATGAPTGVQEREITVSGTARSYVLSVPTSYSSGTPLALVFAWHGLGGSGSLARMYFRVEQQAAGGAIFVYPDALPNAEGQAAWDLSPTGVDVALFDTLLGALSAEYCVDPARVFSTGHSYGGFFTNRLACSRANVLRAVAPVAGGPPFGGGGAACDPVVAAWIAHGSNDATVAFSMGEAARDDYLAANTCGATTAPVELSPCVTYGGCAAGRPVHWCVHQDGHNWPSFAASGIWSFFAQY